MTLLPLGRAAARKLPERVAGDGRNLAPAAERSRGATTAVATQAKVPASKRLGVG